MVGRVSNRDGIGGPQPEEFIRVFVIVVASGAAIGTHVGATIAFLVLVLAVVEIILVRWAVTPAKTKGVVQLVHGWTVAHRRQVTTATLVVAGGWRIGRSIGGF